MFIYTVVSCVFKGHPREQFDGSKEQCYKDENIFILCIKKYICFQGNDTFRFIIIANFLDYSVIISVLDYNIRYIWNS